MINKSNNVPGYTFRLKTAPSSPEIIIVALGKINKVFENVLEIRDITLNLIC